MLARDPAWTSFVGNACVRAIGAWQRRAVRARGLRASRTGAVMFVRRFGGLVNLNVHIHVVVPDGVFVDERAFGSPCTRCQRPPTCSRSSTRGVVIADYDRDALERLCRYGARPAFAQDRLAWTTAASHTG